MALRSLLAAAGASTVIIVSVSACSSSSTGPGSTSGGTPANDAGIDGSVDGGGTGTGGSERCGDPFINNPQCGAADSSNAPFVQCVASKQAAPDFTGGTPPADGTYYLTGCTDHANENTPAPSASDLHLAYKFAITISGSAWSGAETSCTSSGAYTDKFTFTGTVQESSAFIALVRTCGNGFVSGSPYTTSGNTLLMTPGAGPQGETVVFTFTKQ